MNLYYMNNTELRVKIIEVATIGIAKVRDKEGNIYFCFIGSLKKVC